jgi:hypothetical protein
MLLRAESHLRLTPSRVALAVLAVIAVAGCALAAQAVPDGTGAVPHQKLRQSIEARYRVFAVHSGILLVPRENRARVESIELVDGTIAINGEIVTGSELRQRLGADADAIVELSYLEPSDRRALLFGSAGAIVPAPPPLPAPVIEPGEETPTPAPRRRSDARIRIGGSVTVDRNEEVGGAVVAVLGSAVINGRVRDEVVVVGGDIRVGPEAEIGGDVTVVGGRLDLSPTARVRGQINEIGIGIPRLRVGPIDWWGFRGRSFRSFWFSPSADLLLVVLRMLLVALFALVALFVASGPVSRIERRVAADPWKAGLTGLVAQVLFVPLLVLTVIILAVSIIGIPLLLLVPFALLALLIGLVVGFAGVAVRLGGWVRDRLGWTSPTRYGLLVLGMGLIWTISLVGHLAALAGWPVWVLATVLSVAGFLVEYVAWTVGLGAVLLSRFGTRPWRELQVTGSPAEPEHPLADTDLLK